MHLSYLLLCLSCSCVLAYSRDPDLDGLEGLFYPNSSQRPLFPLNSFVSNVNITFSPLHESNARAKKLIAEFARNGAAAAEIEEFDLKLDCDRRMEDVCKTGDALDDFVELTNRGSGYLNSLKRVRWGYDRSVHPPLLRSLETHFPNLDLDVKITLGDLNSLRSSPLLRSLYLFIVPDVLATDETNPLLTHIQTQIMDSKNLKKLTIELGTMGCIMYVVDPKFSKLKDKKFPPLEDLSLEAFPLSTANVDYWMTAMDWSQLRSLELRETRDPTYFLDKTLDSAGGLPGLETVRIELPLFYHSDTGADEEAFRNTFLRFLSEPRTKGLSTVGIEGEYRPYLPTILEEQGATLRSLRLHSSERYRDPQREMLSVQELRGIGLQAPNLEEITVDINKLNGSLPDAFIDTFLSEILFPSLKSVELYGVLGVSDYTYTWQWGGTDQDLADQMPLVSKLASRTALDHITIHVGENERRIGGLPAGWVLWEGKNWEVWEAERNSFGKMVVTVKKGGRLSRTISL